MDLMVHILIDLAAFIALGVFVVYATKGIAFVSARIARPGLWHPSVKLPPTIGWIVLAIVFCFACMVYAGNNWHRNLIAHSPLAAQAPQIRERLEPQAEAPNQHAATASSAART